MLLRFADSTCAQKEHLAGLQKPIDDQKDHAVKQLEDQKAPKEEIMEKEMKTHAKRHEAAESLKKEELEYAIEKIRRRRGDEPRRVGRRGGPEDDDHPERVDDVLLEVGKSGAGRRPGRGPGGRGLVRRVRRPRRAC